MAMPEDQRAELLKDWTADMRRHWQAVAGELHNDPVAFRNIAIQTHCCRRAARQPCPRPI